MTVPSTPASGIVASGPLDSFLRNLRHTGALGFEGLVARLLEAETGQRFRIAGSGFQAGMDMSSETARSHSNRVKAETKHYFSTGLNLRELTAEVAQAAKASDFDLWVLGCSCPVQAQHAAALEECAAEWGIECLFLDRPEAGLSRLEILMAEHPEAVGRFRADCGTSVDGEALATALGLIAADPRFPEGVAQLRAKLRGSLLGYDDARRRAAVNFLATIADAGSAEAVFNQHIALRAPGVKAVIRSALDDGMSAWWTEEATAGRHCVALGEEGFGKSWAVMAWVAGGVEASRLPLTLAFNASAFPLAKDATIEAVLPELLKRWTDRATREHWELRLDRWIRRDDGDTPLLLVVADGLNERADVDWVNFFRPLLHERWRGRAVVLASDRPGHWRPRFSRLERDGFRPLPVGAYTDDELASALADRDVPVADVPRGLHDLVRTPRYCGLVADHFDELRRLGDFTRERLVLLDVKHRRDARRGFPMSDEDFFDVIRNLAHRFRERAEVTIEDVRAMFPGSDASGQIHQEIVDGGLLVATRGASGTRYTVEPTRLVFGLGMLLADDVGRVAAGASGPETIEEAISQWLEPHAASDLKVAVCAAAVFHALLDPDYPAAARRELARYWLGSRNRRTDEEDESRLTFVLRAPADFLSIAETFWTSSKDRGAAQAFLATAFARHRDDDRLGPLLVEAVERWMGAVHPDGPPLIRRLRRDEPDGPRGEIEARVGRTLVPGPLDMCGRKLTVVEDDGLLRMSRFGLLVMSAGARRPFVPGLVAWAVASAVMGAAMERDVAEWVVRLSDEELDVDLLPEARRLLDAGDPVSKSAANILLGLLGTRNAARLADEFPPSPSPDAARLRAEHEASPCTSPFPWTDAECERCLAEPATPLRIVTARALRRLLDPDRDVPDGLKQRLVAALQSIDPGAIRAGFAATMLDHAFDDLHLPLAALAPKELAKTVRHVVGTMRGREAMGRRQLSLWLREIYATLDEPRVRVVREVVEELRADATSWSPSDFGSENISQVTEAFATWALLPLLAPDDRYRELISRPAGAFDFDDMDVWFEPLSEDAIAHALGIVRDPPDEPALRRALWVLGGAVPTLSDADAARIAELAGSADRHVRAMATRFASLSGDDGLCRRIVDLGLSYIRPEESDFHWGYELILRHSSHLSFEELASRTTPAMAGHLLVARGCDLEETRAYAAALEALWARVNAAPEPELPLGPPPDVRISGRRAGRNTSPPDFAESDEPGSTILDGSASWTSGPDEARDANGSAGHPGSATDPLPEGEAKRKALLAAWQSEALGAFGHRFCPAAIAAIHATDPALVERWAADATVRNVAGRRTRFRLGTFAYALCEALLRVDPDRGVGLWEALRERGSAIRFDDAETLFRAPRSATVDAARSELLDSCASDVGLARLAIAADEAGDGWLDETVGRLVEDASLARRARGLTLLSFAHRPRHVVDEAVSRARIDRTWVAAAMPSLLQRHRDDLLARLWYERFLVDEDEEVAWGALQVVAGLADARFLLWRKEAADAAPVRAGRTEMALMSSASLDRALNRHKDREGRLFGLKVARGQIFPFFDA